MEQEDFSQVLPAIWLVFADSYLTHQNAPCQQSDQREKSLLDLLGSYLDCELENASAKQLYEESTLTQIASVRKLLGLWSQDLSLIYKAREGGVHCEKKVKRIAQRFLQRIQTFENCTVIPNGLISANRTKGHENICCAILKKQKFQVDWIQVDPGSTYHQRCHSLEGDKSNAFLEITEIDPDNITEDWLYLLVGLKAIHPSRDRDRGFFYKEVSLYKCLLVHLDGKTTFQSQSDEGFVDYSHTSPSHTWQVINQSFRYLLRHFLGETYHAVYQRFLTGFKLFLMEKVFVAFLDGANNQTDQCHFLLQEMCRSVAKQALDHGNEEQKQNSLKLIQKVKAAIEKHCSQQELQACQSSILKKVEVNSLSFEAPRLNSYNPSSSNLTVPRLKADPVFTKPSKTDDIINYLENFKTNFINKFETFENIYETALLSYGIEEFFIGFLAETDILQKSDRSSFSRDDVYLAKTLKLLAEMYYGCQARMVKDFFDDLTYQPQFYAKNVTIQFFVYAAIAALNFRNEHIGRLLATCNLSTSLNQSLTFEEIIPHLVIDDARWFKVLSATLHFFSPKVSEIELFSRSKFSFRIHNDAIQTDNDVIFAHKLLQIDETAKSRFILDHRDLEEEKFNRKWKALAYTNKYLPALYYLLSEVAYFAKASLTGFPWFTNSNSISIRWDTNWPSYWYSETRFVINGYTVSSEPDSNKSTSYVLKSRFQHKDSYQRLIIRKNNIGEKHPHFFENDIIASQDKKPETVDRIRYMHLGFLQSEPHLKLERLYVALKEQQIDFTSEQEIILIKQTLFENSVLMETNEKVCSLLEWTAHRNPNLINALGLLCIEKTLAVQYRLSQHHAIGNMLEVILGLLTFYPSAYIDTFMEGIITVFRMLKKLLNKPLTHLSDTTLLHLNAYLIMCAQINPKLLEMETFTILNALLSVQNYKVKGIRLDNYLLFRMHVSSFTWCQQLQDYLDQKPALLNELISKVTTQWGTNNSWKKSKNGLLYTCRDYTIKPLIGGIYFKNQPMMGLPDCITDHPVFKEYLGVSNFAVIPTNQKFNKRDVPGYLSVDRTPKLRLTLIEKTLLLEEMIEGNYQRYIPVEEIINGSKYPLMLYKLPHGNEKFRHWLDNEKKILIKDKQRQIIYQWDLNNNTLYSLQHQGYVIPWQHIQKSYFKTWLELVELSDWIGLIAKPLCKTSGINIESLHFPRLGLLFDYRQGKFFSKQIHGYVIADQQHLNILQGFSSYLVLEKKERNSKLQRLKVIIPYRKITPKGSFYVKTTTANRKTAKFPLYFVYDYDPRIGLLKAHHIRARLYLALLFYCSASQDEYDVSSCNAYHLARENLEVCWKDQPYNGIELDIIKHFLSEQARRDLHSYRIALYLKVLSLLSNSISLAFLHIDEEAQQNKKQSHDILKQCARELPHLVLLYFQKKSTISPRIKLSPVEEKDIIEICLSSDVYHKLKEDLLDSAKKSKDLFHHYFPKEALEAFHKHKEVLSNAAAKYYKGDHQEFFSQKNLNDTPFVRTYKENLRHFKFSYDTKGINFSLGIKEILFDRFRLTHFITLYNLAKGSSVSLIKYRYLLYHLLVRALINYPNFPCDLIKMLGRALLLVAENPDMFPESPLWFCENLSVDLSKRELNKGEVLLAFPSLKWRPYTDYAERKMAEEEHKRENELIWSSFRKYDLDALGMPREIPENPSSFKLRYESNTSISSMEKRRIIRQLYQQVAYNCAMYNFFHKVLRKCDQLKKNSAMGWTVAPFIPNSIKTTVFNQQEENFLPTPEPVSLEKWAIPETLLIKLKKYFIINSQPVQMRDYLFESQLTESDKGYQRQFYSELKESWLAYLNKSELSYSWLHSESVRELESKLNEKYDEIHAEAENIWHHIAAQFKQKSNNKSEHYFALRWYSGQVTHYHKGDILKLLVEPSKLEDYNPNCISKQNDIIESILKYVYCEINANKIVRVLAFIDQYKQADSETEKFSVLQELVKSLQEKIDLASYRYPHWLLFQLENEIIVRENQRELIDDMLNESEKAMYQLNMGEGKSSVILPLLSCNLANGTKLLRINVLPALLNTMKDFLNQRFSGLIRKRVYTLPFCRNTNVSMEYLRLIFETLEACQRNQHILLVTPEDRLCLQLKIRELMLDNQYQIGASNIFNWQNYRLRVQIKTGAYRDLSNEQMKQLLARQDKHLKTYLVSKEYIDSDDYILKVPPRGQERNEFAPFRDKFKDDTIFREWSCLKAAYRELLYNSKSAHEDSSGKIALLSKIEDLITIDLLDESDEILRHGTELNYTMGDKCVLSGGQLRWQIPQFFIKAIFCDSELIDIIVRGKTDGFTAFNEHYSSKGGVPFIQLLSESFYENSVKPLLIQKFFLDILPTFRKCQVNADDNLVKGETSSLRHFVSGKLTPNTEKKVMTFLADKGTLKDKLLIAKGWLSHGILFHVFNAKYRVQYGLNLHIQYQIPKQIAIPFLGKDVPSPRSEFSHPDVMLGFTIISYLYEGLDPEQLKKTLLKLKVKFSHQVSDSHLKSWAETSRSWIEPKTESFPPLLLTSFEHLDLSDQQCLDQVHQFLSGNYPAIFFYLNQFVFIEEAMQYRYKISANAHSLVGYNEALGFSGTDDRKITLPYQIKSKRTTTEESTNGKLLSVLTQERNNHYHTLIAEDTTTLLKELCDYVSKKPHCHALIDAGALVTGLTNYEVASYLLSHLLPLGYLGILYFSEEGNSLTVITRDGETMALQDCFLDKRCLFAYLDDIHTRGTDIQLPLDCHAILTIGIGMEKDKLMQAAMRLRKLAQKQSVSLWGTTAVTLAIARDNSIDATAINSFEVIKWVARNTIAHINDNLFSVAVRKIDFQFLKKAQAWLKVAPKRIDTLMQYCKVKELFTLEEFYALSPELQNLADRLYFLIAARMRAFWHELEQELTRKELKNTPFYKLICNQSDKNTFRKELNAICVELDAYLQFDGYVHKSLDDDEEKEVEIEIIKEREVTIKVEKRDAYKEKPWPDARLILKPEFIALANQKGVIMPLTAIRRFVKEPSPITNIIWHRDVYMTSNYINSVKNSVNESLDNYLRPVDAVLIHRCNDESQALLLSGQEASNIKSNCYEELENNLLVHIADIDGPTQLPVGSALSKQELKLFTIIKLFSGECHYQSEKEVCRLARRLGRIYPSYFTNPDAGIDTERSSNLYGLLIEEGYLDHLGVMNGKLLKVLKQAKSGEPVTLETADGENLPHCDFLLKKLLGIYNKLIIKPSASLKEDRSLLRQWVGTRGRLKEYSGSELESIIDSENILRNQL